MNFYKKLKRIVCLGLSLVTIYGTSALAENKDFLLPMNDAEFRDIRFLEDEKTYDYSEHKKDLKYTYSSNLFEADFVGKLSKNGFSQTDMQLDINRYFNSKFKASRLDDFESRIFEFSNTSNFDFGKLEKKLVLDNDLEFSSFNFALSNSYIDIYYKVFNDKFKKGDLIYLGLKPFKVLSLSYGIGSLDEMKDDFFIESLLTIGNFFVCAATKRDEYRIRSGINYKKMGLFLDYADTQEQSYNVVFAINPIIENKDVDLIDETSFKDAGKISFIGVKSLRSFTDKGLALRYFQMDDNHYFIEGVWNPVNLKYEKLGCSLWLEVDYYNNDDKIINNYSLNLTYKNYTFNGGYNANGDVNFSFGYKNNF